MSLMQTVKCKVGVHKIGSWQPAVGGRNVRRCVHCDKVLEEESIVDKVHLPRATLPKGKETDKWFK